MKKDSFIRCLNCNESIFMVRTTTDCPYCNGNDFSEPEIYYWDFCPYCLSVKYFDENIKNAICPDCGKQIDIENDPLSEVKSAIIDVKSGDYTPLLWLAIIVLSLFLMFMAVT